FVALQLARGRARAEPDDGAALRARMDRPTPRIELGLALRGLATAAVDVSDGLLGDLGHVLQRSGVGARLRSDLLPRSAALLRQPAELQLEATLVGGDDYELAFTASAGDHDAILAVALQVGVPVTRVGSITASGGLAILDASDRPM